MTPKKKQTAPSAVEAFRAAYDGDTVDEFTPRQFKEGDIELHVLRLAELGVSLGADVDRATEASVILHTVTAPQVGLEFAAAEAAIERAIQEKHETDALTVLEQVGAAASDLILEPDGVPAAEANLDAVTRKRKAIARAGELARDALGDALASNAITFRLADAWSSAVSFKVEETMTLAQVRGLEGAAETITPSLQFVYQETLRDQRISVDERKRLRLAFKARPSTLPTLDLIRGEAVAEVENSGQAQRQHQAARDDYLRRVKRSRERLHERPPSTVRGRGIENAPRRRPLSAQLCQHRSDRNPSALCLVKVQARSPITHTPSCMKHYQRERRVLIHSEDTRPSLKEMPTPSPY